MRSLLAFSLVLVASLAGCPREVSDPVRPDGRACVTDDDCAPPGTACGLVYVCVDERCTEEPARSEPCE